LNRTTRNVLIAAGAWCAGIYLYQRAFGVIVVNGQTLIPGILDPLGMMLGYPNQLTVSVGAPIDSPQLEAPS
jgi:hypothetical protein